jgi:TP901 family phage tail tape measure protein
MSVQINVAANQAALTASIQAGVQAYNQRFAQNNQLNLTINPRAFSQPLGRITGDVKDFEAALAASNARVIAFGASTAVLGGVIRSFKELANVTIEVEKNLADINRVFGLTTSQLQKFSTDLFNVTKQTASSFNDASQAALEFSRQGLKAEETLQRTKDALTLTRLAGVSTANAVDALTSTVNGFAATGVTTTQILNKLVAVEQDFAVGAGDLAEALSRTGQAAQEAGVSLDQLNALVTSAQQSTARGGAVIGNALKTIFTRLQRTDTLDQLEAFNISVRDVQGNILPAVTILQNFAGAYQNLADAQRAQLSEQVAGVYQVNILKAIVNDLNKSQGVYAGALQRGAMATNEAEVATAKLNQTLDALLKQTATSTQQLANNIGKVTFEPLARYGTEQLKSLVESMNEILEGEGIGSTFANGLLKGIRNILAGPGAIAAFFTLFKLIQNSFTYLSQALPQIAGITTETQNRKNIESAILQIMSQQGVVAQALDGLTGNQAAQAQLLLQTARAQTAEYQKQAALAQQLAVQLSGQGVKVAGSRGLQVTRAGGYIPASTKMAEVVGAKAGGYSPGRVVSSPVGGVMNTAEDVKYVPGFAQPFINPPAGSKAGRAHRQNAINRTGVDPYMASGFLPNFSNPKDVIDKSFTGKLNFLKITSNTEKEEIQKVADLEIVKGIGKNAETINDNIAGTGIRYDVRQYEGSKTNEKYREEAAKLALSGKIDKITKAMPNNKKSLFNGKQWQDNLQTLKDNKIDLTNTALLSNLKLQVPSLSTGKMIDFGKQYTGLLNALSGETFERDIAKKESNFIRSEKGNARLDFIYINEDLAYSGGEAKLGNVTLGNLVAKAIESTGRTYDNGDPDEINFSKPIKLFVPAKHKLLNNGFIPNFSPLIDDNARNKHDFPGGVPILPIPDKALQNIVDRQKKRQMTYLDFDRTLVRTMGDIAYSRVSPDQKKGVLQKMFLNKEARLNDIKNSKLTQFGELLRKKIQEGVINPSLLGLLTASDETPGMPEYISSIWGIPKRNQVYSAKPGTKEARLADLGVSASGFIPNFAPPTSAMRIPWFKKFGNASFDAIQPTLGISKASDTDTFRSSQFRSKAFDKAAIDGDPNLFAPLYEDFAFKAMQLISQSDIKDDLMRGYVLQPGTDQKQSALDAVFRKKGIGVEYKGYRKKNLTGTIGGELKRKYETLSKTNPEEAAKLQELIIVFNEVGHENQLPSDFGKNFSQLAGTSYSEMVKNSPDLVKGLSAETNMLLERYVKDPNFLRMNAAGGFIPNFAMGDKMRTRMMKDNLRVIVHDLKTGKEAYAQPGKKGKEYLYHKDAYNAELKTSGANVNDYDFAELHNLVRGFIYPNGKIVWDYSEKQQEALKDPNIKAKILAKLLAVETRIPKSIESSKPLTDFQRTRALLNNSYSGFIPNFNFIKGRNSFQKNWLIETAKKRNLNLNNPNTFSKLATEFAKTYPNDQGMFGLNKGFIPNFAYKQAVMGLEESMSGNKAIFDTKPFPHIRNSSQPTFSSAISDHGGLGNALSDSMRGQKAAGLMSKGFIPNFGPIRSFKRKAQRNKLSQSSVDNESFNPEELNIQAEKIAKQALDNINNIINLTSTKIQSLIGKTSTNLLSSFTNLSKTADSPEFKQKISNMGTTLAFAGPMAAGLIEQSVFGNRQRTDMSATERQVQSGLSTGLTAASTGASIGSAFGPWGAAIGLAAGAAVGLAQSLGAASLSADELRQVADEYKSKTQENISSAQNYIDTLKTLNTSTDPDIIKKASESLAENFSNIKDVNLQEIFQKTGTDVKKLGDALTQYEKDRKKMQNESEEDFRAAQAGQAKSAKDLTKLGYTKAKTIKGPGLASDFTFLEFKKETDDKILSDYKETFSDLSSLSDQQVKDFSKLISEQKASGYFDKDVVSKFLKDQGMNEGMAEMLTERFDTLEDTSNIVGNYLIDNLIRLFNKNKQKIETVAVDKNVEKKLTNDFIKFKNDLTEKLSDNLIAAANAVKSFEFKNSMANLISNKLKEINDSIFSSISGNLNELGAVLVKTSQLESGRQFQQSQLATLRRQTQRSTSLKNVEARDLYLKQSKETIFSSGGVSRSPESAQKITDFLSTSLNKTRQDFQNFASSLSLSDGEAKNLAVSLEENQRAFREKLNDSKNELLLKQQEFDLTELTNKINYQTGLEQLKLETEKLKITYAQRDATLQLRKDVESYKITSAQSLELKKIDIGSEFRYLGLGKRETFASQQIDQKAVFDEEQKIAQKQAILDARRSIIEIASQEANTAAQDANTEAVLRLVDLIAQQQLEPYLKDIAATKKGSPENEAALGRFSEKATQVSNITSANASLRKAYSERRNVLSYKSLSDFGVTNEMPIKEAIDKLESSKVGKDKTTINAIDNTIQDLTTASNTLGSNATIYAAKVEQAKADFEQSAGFVNNIKIGFQSLTLQSDQMVDQLGRNLPAMFGDGLVDGIKAAIRESDNLGNALMGIASKFLDEISTTLMRSAIYGMLGSIGVPNLSGMGGKQKGGIIRAQSGMYISGTGSGDKYPALLENGEYVLNRKAVMAMGGPAELDKLNFSMAPRFASGGSFSNKFEDISSMEANMTTEGLEQGQLYNELRDIKRQEAETARQKKRARRQQMAGIIGSLAGAAVTLGISAGVNKYANKTTPQKLGEQYGNLALQTDFSNSPFKQVGGSIGSRLSDTIPSYATGGLFESPIVKRYAVGGASPVGLATTAGNSSTVNNNTNANNSFSFNTTVQRDGKIQVGANTTSYAQQDVELSQNLNNKVYEVILDTIRKEKRFGGSLAGVRNS